MKTTYTLSHEELQKLVARHLEKTADLVHVDQADVVFKLNDPYDTITATYELEET